MSNLVRVRLLNDGGYGQYFTRKRDFPVIVWADRRSVGLVMVQPDQLLAIGFESYGLEVAFLTNGVEAELV